MKTCSRCKKERKLDEFGKLTKSADGLQYYCKSCKADVHQKKKSVRLVQINESKVKRIEAARQFVYNHLVEHPCACGESDPIVLEFDHNDNVVKNAEISRMISTGYSVETIKKEIEKCTVRCANCHKRRTSKQFSYWKLNHTRVSSLASNQSLTA